MSPPRRHLCSFRPRSAEIIDAVRRTRRRRRRQRKLHTAAADSGSSKASSAQTNSATCHQGGISQGDDNMGQQPPFEKLPENANTPMLQSKLPHLKNLEIELESGTCCPLIYDIFSLVSFLDASPTLESFILRVEERAMEHYTVVGDDDEWPVRNVGFWHDRLRQVTITGFCSAKSLVELTVHMLESTHSLERLTLDTTRGYDRRNYGTTGKCPNSIKIGRCWGMTKRAIEEANRAVETAGRYITRRVPLAVQYEVLESCSRCHTSKPIDQCQGNPSISHA